MNRFLFDTLAFLNGFLAVIIIALWGLIGWLHPYFATMRPVGLVVGLLLGITIAAIVCGSIEFFALIERHLRVIAERRVVSGGEVGATIARHDTGSRLEPRI